MNRDERTAADIESEIRVTRTRMGDDIEAIGEKLSPRRIKQRAKEAVTRKTREAGSNLIRAARENPVPATMVAVGLTWLFRSRRHKDGWNGYDHDNEWGDESSSSSVKEKAQEVAQAAGDKLHAVGEKVGEKVHEVKERAQQKARRTAYTLESFFEENPIIAGAALAVVGAALGAVLPTTRKENELMGAKRDELVQKAQGVAEHAKEALEEKLDQPPPGQEQPSGQFQSPSRSQPQWQG